MFTGEYNFNLDDNHRLSIPNIYKKYLEETLVIVKGFEKCLYVYNMSAWREIVDKVFTSIGKKQAITDYMKNSNKIISMLEGRRFAGRPLLQAADNLVTKLGKTDAFFRGEFKKCGKDYKEFDRVKDKIMGFWCLGRKPEDEDVERVFLDAKEVVDFSSEVSEEMGKRHIKGALSFDRDMAEFKSTLDREFPVIIEETNIDEMIQDINN